MLCKYFVGKYCACIYEEKKRPCEQTVFGNFPLNYKSWWWLSKHPLNITLARSLAHLQPSVNSTVLSFLRIPNVWWKQAIKWTNGNHMKTIKYLLSLITHRIASHRLNRLCIDLCVCVNHFILTSVLSAIIIDLLNL